MDQRLNGDIGKAPSPGPIALEDRWCAHTYKPLPVVITRAQGAWVHDEAGRRYLDMMSAYSAVNVGHSHPRILKALTEQASKVAVVSRAFHTDKLGPFLERLCALTGLDGACPMNSGAEAVETAVKAARRWGYRHRGIPANQAEIIVASGNFHGRTTTIISFSSEEAYREGFGPYTPGFRVVPFGDLDALTAAIGPNTAAVLLEPIQGEAGIVLPPAGYLKDVRAACDRAGILMILDEIQSGLGRTGRWFAHQHEGIVPDGLCLGKALGGGVLPVSAFVARRDVIDVFDPGSHGSTFGGNPLAAAVGLEALAVIEDEGLVQRSAALGAHLMDRLRGLNSPLIRDIRGLGLWVGLEIDPARATARQVVEDWMRRGVLSKETHDTVVRLAPPLMIAPEDLDWAVDRLAETLSAFA
ncbi:ornithine--oxo-acid transaminase [Nitrospirillum amazonense]|uniref:ornithine aminotransferase n=1 Tax=Nitrospirillum amazonense TaxID=28077 RepID=A0A560F0A5_9PROT|nr:ornithine--oxo-acid transaminase [Nitrospirillum amazonense]TWB15056.1 ornithine--oxo-acid transaminase [Nitrospirillum amazonense]